MVLLEGAVVGLSVEINLYELHVAAGVEVTGCLREHARYDGWAGDLLVDVADVFWPTLDTKGHHPAMDVVKRLRERPWLFNIVDKELDVWGNAKNLSASCVMPGQGL